MIKTCVIHWKSTVNGRTGQGTKLFEKEDGRRLVEELNREYPQIQHELIEIESAPTESQLSSTSVPLLSPA